MAFSVPQVGVRIIFVTGIWAVWINQKENNVNWSKVSIIRHKSMNLPSDIQPIFSLSLLGNVFLQHLKNRQYFGSGLRPNGQMVVFWFWGF